MKILIQDQRQIFDIKEEFNTVYPYLKLEIFSKPHSQDWTEMKQLLQYNTKTIEQFRTIHDTNELSIDPEMTVAELEALFRSVFGLYIRVLRKSGNIWLETTKTSDWTLETQNSEGEFLSRKKSG